MRFIFRSFGPMLECRQTYLPFAASARFLNALKSLAEPQSRRR